MTRPAEHKKDLHEGIQKRLATVNGAGALMITLLVIASVWGQWHTMALIGAINGLVVASNLFVTFVLLSRMSRLNAELVRGVINVGTGVWIAHVAGWPLAGWLFLPYVALVFDHVAPRTTLLMVVVTCASNSTVAIVDGVSPLVPLSFTLFAFFCFQISRTRFSVIRDMLTGSEADRAELARAYEALQLETAARERAEVELRQHQKLQAVGRLAAGIAHEINTPVQFVADSVTFLKDASHDLLKLSQQQRTLLLRATQGEDAASILAALQSAEQEADAAFLKEELPASCDRVLDGVERITAIVRSVKEFAHPDERTRAPMDLNHAIETTLTIAAHEYRMAADVETDLAPLPPVMCHGGEVNQVLLNLIVNAAHAIADKPNRVERGRIRVTSAAVNGEVIIAIKDTGAGIPEDIRPRIFEAFFTTKAVGRGTGQGLAVSRSVVERCGGTLTFQSTVGEGTTFFVRLPAHASPRMAA
jgi:signal transduction histidine kinase